MKLDSLLTGSKMAENLDYHHLINIDTGDFQDLDQAMESLFPETIHDSSALQMIKDEQSDNYVYLDISNNVGYSSNPGLNRVCYSNVSMGHSQTHDMSSNAEYFKRGDASGTESLSCLYNSYLLDQSDSDNESVTLSEGTMNQVREHDGLSKSHQRIQMSLPHFEKVFCTTRKKVSKRGRPNTYPKRLDVSESDDDDNNTCTLSPDSPNGKKKRGAKNILLWKFLLEQLAEEDAAHVQWQDKEKGIFRFIDTTETSRRWGQMKRKTDMNFEKLSRGIRHYYKDGLMQRLNGTRLVYKFNWSKVPKRYYRELFT
ncbi:hypothetical protein ACJMK2_019526 [Sinanodonta woodiana]|uniref:ETS domain-containing protein n=1 Tax=Sinanodonta woodiana TaxID=1069815 RepID=A0ABD3TZF2_SINWO